MMMPRNNNPLVLMVATAKGRAYNEGERFWAAPAEAERMVAQGVADYFQASVPAPAPKPAEPAAKEAKDKHTKPSRRTITKAPTPKVPKAEVSTPAVVPPGKYTKEELEAAIDVQIGTGSKVAANPIAE